MLALVEYIAIFPSMPVSNMVQNAQPFFLKVFSVPVASCAAPPEMINYGFYPWLQFLRTLLFAQLGKLFLNILSHMPNIELMVYFTFLFTHVTTDFLMSISGKT